MIKNNNKGFSLIELMVVVGIIGILAAVAVPNLLKFQAKAKQSNAKTELSALYGTEKAYMVEYNTYTPNFMALGYAPDGVPTVSGKPGCPSPAPSAPTIDGTVVGWPLRYYASGFTGVTTAGVPASLTGAFACPTISVGNTYGFKNYAADLGADAIVTQGNTGVSPKFLAKSIGKISTDEGIGEDVWTINHNKELLNIKIGY